MSLVFFATCHSRHHLAVFRHLIFFALHLSLHHLLSTRISITIPSLAVRSHRDTESKSRYHETDSDRDTESSSPVAPGARTGFWGTTCSIFALAWITVAFDTGTWLRFFGYHKKKRKKIKGSLIAYINTLRNLEILSEFFTTCHIRHCLAMFTHGIVIVWWRWHHLRWHDSRWIHGHHMTRGCVRRAHHLFHPSHISSHRIDSPDHDDCAECTWDDTEYCDRWIASIQERRLSIAGSVHTEKEKKIN